MRWPSYTRLWPTWVILLNLLVAGGLVYGRALVSAVRAKVSYAGESGRTLGN